MIQNKNLGFIALILLASIALFFHYKPYVLDPQGTFFNLYGDGYKNYYTVYYHVKHDPSYTHFEGMNYPYGEHIMYTDGQPVLANTLKFICRNIVDVSDFTVSIMNGALIFSFLLCAIFLYLVFIRLGLVPWFALGAALGIMLMSPQHLRAIGHFSLAYAFVIPLTLYLLLRFEEKPSFKISACIGGLVLFVGLLHLYHLAMIGMMIGFYFLFSFLRNRDWKYAFKLALHYSLQIILPFVLIQLWVMSTDHIADRPKVPLGFLYYRAHWEGLLTSVRLPYWAWVDRNVIDIRNLDFESEVYLGIVGIVGLFAFIGPLLRKKILQNRENLADRFFRSLFPAVSIMALVSLGLPFVLPGLDFLVDYVGPYRQFRGQARFAWAFYYGWNILCWYLIYQKWLSWQGSKKLLWVPFAFLILGVEAFLLSKASFINPWKDPEHYDKQSFESSSKFWFKDVKLLDYQAILPLPYFHNGSENFVMDAPGDLVRFATLGSWHYGLQNMGVNLSRTSFSQSLHSVPLNLLPYRPYEIVKYLPYAKPLLIVLDNAQYFSKVQDSRYLMYFSKILYVDSLVQIRELPLQAFDQAVAAWRQDIRIGYDTALQKGFMKNGYLLPDSTYQFYYDGFDQIKSPKKYQGTGAFVGNGRRKAPFVTFQTPAANNECAVWVYLGEDQRAHMNFKGYELDAAGNEKLVVHNACRMDLKILDNNGWGLVVFPINVSRPGATVRMELEYQDMTIRETYIDEFLVRPVGRPQDNIYCKKGDLLIFNNMYFPGMF